MFVGVFEAKTRLSELLERAERGEEIVITRRGQPIARLAPIGLRPGKIDLERLFAENARVRRGLPPTGVAELKQDRDEGRR
jgi:prevent-host-death family protein